MSKSFLNGFLEQVKDTPIGRVALEYFTKHSHFEGFVFVEGSSDIDFYSQTITLTWLGALTFVTTLPPSFLCSISTTPKGVGNLPLHQSRLPKQGLIVNSSQPDLVTSTPKTFSVRK